MAVPQGYTHFIIFTYIINTQPKHIAAPPADLEKTQTRPTHTHNTKNKAHVSY